MFLVSLVSRFVPSGEDYLSTSYTTRCAANDDQSSWKTGKSFPKGQCIEEYCLFDIASDPCEYHNVAKQHPEIVSSMMERLTQFQRTAILEESVYDCPPVLIDLVVNDSEHEGQIKTIKAWRPCDMLDPYPNPSTTVFYVSDL
jgi:hypothetical protein